MRRTWGAVAVALALLAAGGAAAASGDGAKSNSRGVAQGSVAADAKPKAKPEPKPKAKAAVPSAASFVYTVNGSPITVADLWAFLQSKMTMMHAFRIGRGAETFQELAHKRVDEELLLQEAVRRGLGPEVERGILRFRRNWIVAADLQRALTVAIVVPPAMIEARLPSDFRTFKIRQVLLENAEDAEAVRRRLAAGEDFVTLVRAVSIGPEARKDGLLWDYKAGSGIYDEETEKYLFSLALNEISRVIPLQLGYAVVRVEEKRDAPPGIADRARERARSALQREALRKQVDDLIAAGGERSELDREALNPLVLDWHDKGVISDREVGRVAGNVVLFSELVFWQKEKVDPTPNPTVDEMLTKLVSVLKSILDDTVVAAAAQRQGHKLGKDAQVGLDYHKRSAMLAELHRRLVANVATVKEEELRPYWEAHRDDFRVTEAVEVRHILVKDESEAVKLTKEVRGGADFAALAKEHSTDTSTYEKGGNLGFLERGKAVQAFEDAAFALREPGEITKVPVRSQYGVHVIQLISRRAASERSFEASRADVRTLLLREKENALETKIAEELREKGKIVADETSLSHVREAFLKRLEKKPAKAPMGHH